MGDPVTMAMVGAAVGGGGSLLKGKSLGKSLKNAAIGGTLGYGGGLAGQGLGLSGAAGGAGGASSLAPEALAGTIESSGMVFNPATGSYLAPESFLLEGTSMPIFTGGEGLLSNSLSGLTDMIPTSLSDYATPQNLLGVSQVLAQPSPAPNFSGGGGVRGGGAVQYEPMSNVVVSSRKRRMSQNG
jgi:hypothetical protein